MHKVFLQHLISSANSPALSCQCSVYISLACTSAPSTHVLETFHTNNVSLLRIFLWNSPMLSLFFSILVIIFVGTEVVPSQQAFHWYNFTFSSRSLHHATPLGTSFFWALNIVDSVGADSFSSALPPLFRVSNTFCQTQINCVYLLINKVISEKTLASNLIPWTVP